MAKLNVRGKMTMRTGMGYLALACLMIATALPAKAAAQLASPTSDATVPEDRAFDAEDARLNAAYQALAASLDDAKRKALRDEERIWIRDADKTCAKGKNYCRRLHTANRADELERRMGGVASMSGEWGYRTDCNFGHDAELSVPKPPGDIVGRWTDGTRQSGSQGDFHGEWRDGRLYVRFCERGDASGAYPTCPKFGDIDAYMVVDGKHLVWFRAVGPATEGRFEKYVTLSRKPVYGDVPKDNHCKE
jgi:uncharacterized protein YecT (DUF1311 family)